MTNKKGDLLREHTDILLNLDDNEILDSNDPDLLRMEEIMREIKKLEKDES